MYLAALFFSFPSHSRVKCTFSRARRCNLAFTPLTAAEPSGTAVAGDHPMAGDDQGYRVAGHNLAHRAGSVRFLPTALATSA